MIVENLAADEVVKNRQKIEKQLIRRNAEITVTDLAEFFYCPIKAIEKDLKDLGLELSDSKSWVNIKKLRDNRDQKLIRAIESGKNQRTVLESFGLYRMPVEITMSDIHKDMKRNGLSEEIIANTERALFNMTLGIKLSHTKSNIGLTILEVELIKKYQDSFPQIKTMEEDVRDMEIKMVREGQKSGIVSQMGGYLGENTLELAAKHHKAPSKEKLLKKADKEPSEKKKLKEQLKEDAYQRWTAKECTQQELAVEYGVTRVSVMNWIREKKMEHMAERKDPLTRQRNVKREKKGEMDMRRDLIINTFKAEPDLSLSELAEITGQRYNLCRQTLIDADLYATRYEENGEPEIRRGVKEAERAFSRNLPAHFGQGPNKDQFTTRKHNDYWKMLAGQHEMKSEIRKDPALETAIKMGRGSGHLMSTYCRQRQTEEEMEH